MPRALLFMFILAITVYAFVDCLNASDEDRRGLPKGLWLIIILLPVFGPVSWFLISSSQRRARMAAGRGPISPGSGGGRTHGSHSHVRPNRPISPDDDPDFLWRLEQERRRQVREERAREADGDSPTSPTSAADAADAADGNTPDSSDASGEPESK